MKLIVCTCMYVNAYSTVTLDSSADSVCPGDTVVFTCATDTGELIWNVSGHLLYFNNFEESRPESLSIFEVSLTSKHGSNFISTAIVKNVHLDHNGSKISCNDSATPQLSSTRTSKVIVSGIGCKSA